MRRKGWLRMRIAIVMADLGRRESLRIALASAGFEIALCGCDAHAALDALPRELIDVLLIDMILPGTDAPAVIREIRRSPALLMPAAIVMCQAALPALEEAAFREGACAVLPKPLVLGTLSDLCQHITATDRLTRTGADEDAIANVLLSLGFRHCMIGTRYLAHCIYIASKDARLVQSLTTRLYPLIAEVFDSTPNRVAHAMRRAIETAWSHGDIDTQYRMFGYTIDERRGKPTVGELIALLSQQIRTKEAEGESL